MGLMVLLHYPRCLHRYTWQGLWGMSSQCPTTGLLVQIMTQDISRWACLCLTCIAGPACLGLKDISHICAWIWHPLRCQRGSLMTHYIYISSVPCLPCCCCRCADAELSCAKRSTCDVNFDLALTELIMSTCNLHRVTHLRL